MNYDRQLTISSAGNRKSMHWPAQVIFFSELVERFRTPARGQETQAVYLSMKKSEQDELKDVGGFVGGSLAHHRRKAANVQGRDLITLDLDNIPAGTTHDILRRLDALGCAYVVYSTRKHMPSAPRLRVIIPIDRTVSADEYEPLGRKIAAIIGIDLCDPTTFEASRLMYWPSCSADAEYIFTFADKPFVSADGILDMYANWRDVSEWPQVPGAQEAHAKIASKQADPTEKHGIIGAFCRVYDIYGAMDKFLLGIYLPTDDGTGRYTYTGGSTTGGAVVYDNGKFLFSHHATDPCSGRLVNAFDLVRLHKFSELDDDAKADTPVNKLPSYVAMNELAMKDDTIGALIDQENYTRLTEDFSRFIPEATIVPDANSTSLEPQTPDTTWMSMLERNPNNGAYEKNAKNVQVVLEHDPILRGRIYLDAFANRLMVIAPLPWGSRFHQQGEYPWEQQDDAGISVYLDRLLGIKPGKLIDAAIYDHAARHARNPVKEYLLSVEWDGVPRVDKLFVDYLGAEDCAFIRTVTRKELVAGVARIMEDSVKFDNMIVISGPQDLGKSTLLRKLGRHWFTDSIKTFEGKEAEELIEGKWIVEIAELQAFSKSDINRVKQFLSKVDDQYRAAYGRSVKTQIRRVTFYGTTNNREYLQDPTGNRRFWPVEALIEQPTKNVFKDLTENEVHQIWAEAVFRWRLGETLYLTKEMEEEAKQRRENYTERDVLEGQIEEFLEKPIPEDWQKWDRGRRMMFWSGAEKGATLTLIQRDRVCAAEIWHECIGERRMAVKQEIMRINAILDKLPEWERATTMRFGANYGIQRGFKRKSMT